MSTECVVCGDNISYDPRPWSAIETTAGLKFSCDIHSPDDIRNAVVRVESASGRERDHG